MPARQGHSGGALAGRTNKDQKKPSEIGYTAISERFFDLENRFYIKSFWKYQLRKSSTTSLRYCPSPKYHWCPIEKPTGNGLLSFPGCLFVTFCTSKKLQIKRCEVRRGVLLQYLRHCKSVSAYPQKSYKYYLLLLRRYPPIYSSAISNSPTPCRNIL